MTAPSTSLEFIDLVRKSGVLDEPRLTAYVEQLQRVNDLPRQPDKLAGLMYRDRLLTHFQAENFLRGRWRRFTIGKYRVLERIATGGMGTVYLCEHQFMRRRAAVKVLPAAKASDPASLERFYREARAVAALDHPNIVRAYDVDKDDGLNYLVMEYVDGSTLQDIVKRHGPFDPIRAAHYMRQAALGLQHAHDFAGLIHRDIKPGNVILDRSGTIKILDLGLARFFDDQDDLLTRQHNDSVLGTADYLAPEQVLDSHDVDIRADIYGLGATFYYCLTGKTPFGEGTIAQKLIWHQTRQPKSVHSLRKEIPEGIAAVVDKMMAKELGQRYQTPMDVVEALASWTEGSIPSPPEKEMPALHFGGRTNLNERPSAQRTVSAAEIEPRPEALDKPVDSLLRETSVDPSISSPTLPVDSSLEPTPTLLPQKAAPQLEPDQPDGDDGNFAFEPVTPGGGDAEDDCLPWQNFTKPGFRTVSQQVPKPTSSNKPAGRSELARRAIRSRITLLAVGCGLAIVVLCIIIWAVLGDHGASSGKPPVSADGRQLVVSRDPTKGEFRKLRDALNHAKSKDHIVLADSVFEELGFLTRNSDVTIEPEDKKQVVWRFPEKVTRSDCLLLINGVARVHLRGLILDGDYKVDHGILVGKTPGLTLEDVTIRGFKENGVLFVGCSATPELPVSLLRVETQTDRPAKAAIAFRTGRNSEPNENITIRNCRFNGRYQSTIVSHDGAKLPSVIFEGNQPPASSEEPAK
jgi:serine/threonine protein kinase